MNEPEAVEIAESLRRRVDQSWGDSTERFGWQTEFEYLARLAPELAKALQISRDCEHRKWQEYSFYWAEQRRRRRESSRGSINKI